MSLKARIEAVIYAAEEPVALAQLASLFREEALASRAARNASAHGTATEAPQAAVASGPGRAEVISTHSEEPSVEGAELRPAFEAADSPSAPTEVPSAQAEIPQEAAYIPASEPTAQDSADAEVTTPDFAGELQPVSESTAWEPREGAAAEMSDLTAEPAPLSPEEEKRIARQRDREVREEIRRIVDELIAEYSASDRGLEIREVAGGFRFGTRPEYHDAVRAFVKSLKPLMKLSLQALETLAVIAYKQPITAPEIAEIRGVDSGGVLGSLVARKLITTAGRKQVIGRPILYKTTREFLLRFGLRDLNELPSIEEFEKMAGELTEPEEENAAAAEELPFARNEIAALEASAGTAPEATEPQSDPSVAPTSEHDAPAPVEEPQS